MLGANAPRAKLVGPLCDLETSSVHHFLQFPFFPSIIPSITSSFNSSMEFLDLGTHPTMYVQNSSRESLRGFNRKRVAYIVLSSLVACSEMVSM